MSNTKFVRIPPDSTGKRLQHSLATDIHYNTGDYLFQIGDRVTGVSTGATGQVTSVNNANTQLTGEILLVMVEGSAENFLVGERIEVDGVEHATIAQATPLYTPRTQLVGGSKPLSPVEIDEAGSLYIRTEEGSLLLDAFGSLKTSNKETIGEYTFQYDTLPEDFDHQITNGGTITHHAPSASVVLGCGTSIGDKISSTSHLYHKYLPGISSEIQMTVAPGDAGKAGVVRRWGYFDDNDGVYFELNGTDLSVVLRSSTTGVLSHQTVAQADWNGDRLDGQGGEFNRSRGVLNLTDLNLWWIDIQWLGAGRVRWGIYQDGQRITLHSRDRTMTAAAHLPFMRTGTLPLRFEQENTGAAASTSEMRITCTSVAVGGIFNPKERPFSSPYELPPIPVSSNSYVPLLSGRPKQTFKGQANRTVVIPKNFSIYVYGTSAVAFAIVKNGTLTGDTWPLNMGADSALEVDGSATAITGGRTVWTGRMAGGTQYDFDLTEIFGYTKENVKRHADVAETDIFTLVCRVIKVGDPAVEVSFTLNWTEIQ